MKITESQNAQEANALRGLPTVWRERADDLRRWAAADGAARALEGAASELDAALRREDDDVLSPHDAALASGYSTEHIRRILRQQPHLNCGRRGKPAIRRRDLPQRVGALARQASAIYDAIADARSPMSRQGAR